MSPNSKMKVGISKIFPEIWTYLLFRDKPRYI